ncbi:lysozyme inhibitor LprI family protein [Fischerella sp. JS2]|uniref:lysozyme inhibitor LprI family protein n=1 Tax=Fischerella sp. JS2 TaxID=2597771 RepID=UPI0028E290F6|nr:lysozyme inhibitor LprI family protein [Fischerella sp. JS2]
MMNFKLLALVAPILLAMNILPSLARDTSQQIAQTVNCNNPQTTQQMIICSDRAYKGADQKLNQVYKALQTKITANQKKRLTNAQLAWIKFRDTACEFEAGQFEGGTLASPTKLNCLTRITQQRTQDLNSSLQELNNR